jgi:uncharacterized OsmC-like protein
MPGRSGAAGAAKVNGVDLDRLGRMVEAMKAVPVLAKFTFRATNQWVSGGLNRSTIGGYRGAAAENPRDRIVIESGQPALVFGDDEAPNPFDYLLHALAGCLTTTFVYQAALEGVSIRALESHVEGELDLRGFLGVREEVAGGFERLSVRFRVRADCPAKTLSDLVACAQRRSPIAAVVARAVPMAVTCEPF